MVRPRRFEHEHDPGPVQIQARKVHFDVSDVHACSGFQGIRWPPNFASLLNIVLPPIEPLVRRGFQRGAAAG